jgi:hypothetical protein
MYNITHARRPTDRGAEAEPGGRTLGRPPDACARGACQARGDWAVGGAAEVRGRMGLVNAIPRRLVGAPPTAAHGRGAPELRTGLRSVWTQAPAPQAASAVNSASLLVNGDDPRQVRRISAHNLSRGADPAHCPAGADSEPFLGARPPAGKLQGENDRVGFDISAPRGWAKGLASPRNQQLETVRDPGARRPRPEMPGSGSGKKEASHLFFYVFPLPPPAISNPLEVQ